ncbi:putative lipopolysaccharide biosynthesis protein [Vibrio cholerae]|nr:putative lipopolysaccharide biosynthesis protein [Vibrio cholerae]CSC33396.1 putative lipopolysaccharide biosynthesis protein [Vibrio cholerae]CSC49371.1 putative lipopolysaccharide biosynthesis protein [Vibrio cholerae]CSC70952.1 putative lipopolysaccharide biosynthesis protein [Vibrio cholerae]
MPQQVDWRTRVKDPNAMQRITAQQVIAMFERAAADIMATQVND